MAPLADDIVGYAFGAFFLDRPGHRLLKRNGAATEAVRIADGWFYVLETLLANSGVVVFSKAHPNR